MPFPRQGTSLLTVLVVLALLASIAILGGCNLTGSEGNRHLPKPREVFPVTHTPAWSPDGDRIAYHHDARYTEDTTDVSGLYILSLETDSARLLVEGSARSPDWGPTGTGSPSRVATSTPSDPTAPNCAA